MAIAFPTSPNADTNEYIKVMNTTDTIYDDSRNIGSFAMYIPRTWAPSIVTVHCRMLMMLNRNNFPAYISRGVYLVL